MPPNNDYSDKLNRFQAAFERGQRGDVGSFDIWLDEHGYHADRVDAETVADFFQHHPDETANHQDALDTIGEYIGFATNRSEVHHLAVTGPTGIGKTQLIATILHLLPAINSEIDSQSLDASTFSERVDDQFTFSDHVSDVQNLHQPVLCIDDCHLDKRIEVSLTELHDVIDTGVIITTWTPEGYIFNRERVADAVPPSKELQLAPFSTAETMATIDAIHDVISDDAAVFDDEAQERIYALSHGIPGIVVTIMLYALRVAFMNELAPGSPASVETAGERLHLADGMDRIYDLSEQKIEILRWILLSRDKRGRSPGDLVDKLDRDKSTISYHLRTLSDGGFVTSQSEGRRSYYQVPDQLAPFIQLRLAQDSQFHAEL